jgi:phosphatidylserine/phosphatidylglycerophosphate/cardiolipin synthase-like enzyme
VPPQPARHLVQVCRSGYRPAPGSGSTPLPWSPLGEPTIANAIVKAIGSAREYISIEDQYFTPHDPYIAALLDAAQREPSLRLLVVMPSASDQVFGDVRHKEMFELLRDGRPGEEGYGDRMILAAPVRRPLLGDAGRTASLGRLVLQGNLSAVDDQILLGPRSRLPDVSVLSPFVPFWLWVEGERMLAVEKRDDVLSDSQIPSRRFLVLRAGGAATRWGASPRAHPAGAAVTMAQIPGIYVHTKAIMVDDIFVGIGSCNTNRRGFFHDGEIQAFAVPEQLKAARDNPALALRTALWAEHLGLPPAMGRTLLADPVAAFELFRRPTYVGNRMSSFEALGPRTDLAFLGEKVAWAETIATLLGTVGPDLLPFMWNVIIEPTTGSDPGPVLGPEIGNV